MAHQPNSENEPSSKSSNKAPPAPNDTNGLRFSFLTLFPEIFEPVLGASLLGKARARGIVGYDLIQIRDFATDKHHTADDTPFGGGEGMVLKVDVLHAAWKAAKAAAKTRADTRLQKKDDARVLTLLMSPQGPLFTQEMAKEFATYDELILVSGHYEGVDERFIDLCVDREVSIGDYVLTGGELPALVIADTVTRLLPGVVGNERSLSAESLEAGLLKYPQYTRPREYEGSVVPEVLLGGDHQAIARWRAEHRSERTKTKRPDLWKKQSGPKSKLE